MDVRVTGYEVNLESLCRRQKFVPDQVRSARLVYPKGAVPNSQLLWIRVELTNGERPIVTLPLSEFYEYIDLPESRLGGLIEDD